MKKFLAVMMFAGFASVSQGALLTLSCTPNPLTLNGSSNAGVETCNTAPLIGTTINSISVFLRFDLLSTNNAASASFSIIGPGTLSFAGVATALVPADNGTVLIPAGEFGLWQAGASIVLNESFSGSDSVLSGSFIKEINVNYTPGTVPEPGSLALLGSGLLGLGLMARKRRAQR